MVVQNNYTKHATREYAIHRDLEHDNVVKLYDVFEIDLNAFATVLDLCEGCLLYTSPSPRDS